jgi:uncharacterized membrane protein
MATAVGPASGRSLIQPRHVILGSLLAMMVVVWFTRDHLLLVPNSHLRQHLAQASSLAMLHGIPSAAALFLGVLQFSSRIRARHLKWHKMMGRIYVGGVFIGAPAAVALATALPTPTLTPAAYIQAGGWVLTTATALYCVRTGRIQQHREWMIRSYPFAMVFVVDRAMFAIPAIARMGVVGVETVVWGCIAVAGLLPSFLIEWEKLAAGRRAVKTQAA